MLINLYVWGGGLSSTQLPL